MWILILISFCLALLFGGMWWVAALGLSGYALFNHFQKAQNHALSMGTGGWQ